jgi:hypothetical protein
MSEQYRSTADYTRKLSDAHLLRSEEPGKLYGHRLYEKDALAETNISMG